jgi:hypothetical protein
VRLSRETFNSIRVLLVDDDTLKKQRTNFWAPYTVQQRLATVLYYCGQGLGFSALETATGMSDSLISEIVPDVTMVSKVYTAFRGVSQSLYLNENACPPCCVQTGKLFCEASRNRGMNVV